MSRKLRWRRVLVKLSGEALMGSQDFGIDPQTVDRVAKEIAEAVSLGAQVGVVVGGGNIFRGVAVAAKGGNRVTGDHMGMLATVMNSLTLADALRRLGVPAVCCPPCRFLPSARPSRSAAPSATWKMAT